MPGLHAEDDALHRFRRVARRELEGGELLDLVRGAEPGRGVHQKRGRVRHPARLADQAAKRVGDEGRDLEPRVGLRRFCSRVVFPADGADRAAGPYAGLGEEIGEGRRAAAVLAEQAERRIEPDVEVDCRRAGGALILRAGKKHRLPPRHEDHERFFEARIEAGQKGEVGEVLAVGIDDRGSKSRCVDAFGECSETRRIEALREFRTNVGDAEIGKLGVDQADAGSKLAARATGVLEFGRRRQPVFGVRLAALDPHEVVGERFIGVAPLAVRPFDADLGALGGAEADMDEAGLARGVAAADGNGARHGVVAGLDRDARADGVAVGVGLSELDLQPVAERHVPPSGAGAEIAEEADRRLAVDHDEVEHAVEIEVDERGAASALRRGDAGLSADLGEGPVPPAEEQVVGIVGGELRHRLDVALGDEEIEQAVIVHVGELAVPAGRGAEVAAGIGPRRGHADVKAMSL